MQPPGELIYVSERKLRHLAAHFGIDTRRFDSELTLKGSARAKIPLAPGTRIEGSVEGSAQRIDDDAPQRELHRLLDAVTAALQAAVPLPHVDAEAAMREETPRQGDWFRFRRPLRFGVGAADADHAVRALVLVDESPVDEDGVVPGLLLTGAPQHLREPYAYDVPESVAGARSGSGSGELFKWLQQARLTLDADARAGLGGPAAALFGSSPVRDRGSTAISMYRLFARDDWLEPPFPDIARPAFCEGVAIASLPVAASDITVIMGSPLYVRVASAEEDADEARHERPWLARLLRKQSR